MQRRAGIADSRTCDPSRRVSGNPSGTSKAVAEARSLARAHGQRALERLVELIDDPDPRVAFMASREVLDRAYGKPAPALDGDEEDKKVTVVIRHFQEEVLPAPSRMKET